MIDLTEMSRLINHPDALGLALHIEVHSDDAERPFTARVHTFYFGHGATAKEAVDAAVADWSNARKAA